MDIMNFSKELQFNFSKIIACVLHMGNIKPVQDRDEQAHLKDMTNVEKLCHILGISSTDFAKNVLRPEIKAGNDWVTQSRTVGQVLYSLESLARAIYERMFEKLVDQINISINRAEKEKSSFIGVLDIAGFEIFETNSLEQLWINYTNEKLQQFFNHHMFQREQEEYQKEEIKWDFIDFGLDLQPTIDLIEKSNPVGILSCLDEECVMPKATDKTFTEKLNSIWVNKNSKYEHLKFKQGFLVCHYASKVEYLTDGWLDKNKDPLNENVTKLIAHSSDKFIASLFVDYKNSAPLSIRSRKKRGAFRTVSQRHKEQLALLMNQLNLTEPHFVRCILPNHEKKPGRLDIKLVIDQLRCNGVLEGIRICRAGFPNKLLFSEFRHRYQILGTPNLYSGFMDGKKATQLLLKDIDLDKLQYRLGTSKVFFRAGVLGVLEEVREKKISKLVTTSQSICRGFMARKSYNRRSDQLKALLIIQKNARIYNSLREWPWWRLYTKVKPLLNVTRVDEEIKKRETYIKAIESKVETIRKENISMVSSYDKILAEKKELEETLFSERNHSIDTEEILRRTQERATGLEEELTLVTKEYESAELLNEENIAYINKLESQIKKLSEEAQIEREKNVEYETKLEDYKQTLNETNKNLTELSFMAEKSKVDNEEKTKMINEYEEKILSMQKAFEEKEHSYENKIKEFTTTISNLVEKNNQFTYKERTTEEIIKKKQEEIISNTRSFNDLQKLSDNLKEENQLYKVQINKEIEVSTKLKEALGQEKLQRELLEKDLESLKFDKQLLLKEKTKQESQLSELREIVEHKGDEENKFENIRIEREQEITKLQRANEDLSAQIKEHKLTTLKECETMKLENIAKTEEATKLRKINSQLEERVSTIKNDLIELQTVLEKTNHEKSTLIEEFTVLKLKSQETEQTRIEYQNSIKEMNDCIDTLNQKIAQMEVEKQNLKKEIKECNESINELRTLKEKENLQSQVLEKMNLKYKSKIDQLNKLIEEQKESILKLNEKLDQKDQETELNNISSKNDYANKLKLYEEKVKDLENLINEYNNSTNDLQKELESANRLKSKALNELADMKHQHQKETLLLNSAQNNIKIIEEEYSKIESLYKVEKTENAKLKTHFSKLQNELEICRIQLEEKHVAYQNLSNIKSQLENDLKSLINEIGRDDSTMFELEKEKRKNEANMQSVLSKLKLSETENIKFEKEIERLTKLNGDLQGKLEADKQTVKELRSALMHEIDHLGERLSQQSELYKEESLLKKKYEEENTELHKIINKNKTYRTEIDKNKVQYEDLISELESKLQNEIKNRHDIESLAKRQENKANCLQDELESLELQTETLQAYKKKNESIINELKEELEEYKKNYSQQALTFQNEIEYLESKLMESEEAKAKMEDEVSKRNKRKSIPEEFSSERYKKLEESSKAMLVSQRSMQQELEYKNEEIKNLEKQKFSYINEINRAKTQSEQYQITIEELTTKLTETYQANDMQNTKLNELNEEIFKHKKMISDLSSEIDDKIIQISKLKKAQLQSNSKLEEYESTIRQFLENKEHYMEKIKELEDEISMSSKIQHNDPEETKKINELMEKYEKIQEETIKGFEERDAIIKSMEEKYQKQLSDLSISLEKERHKYLSTNEANEKLRQMINEIKSSSHECSAKSLETEKANKILENKLHELESINQYNIEKIKSLNQKVLEAQSESEELRHNLENHENENKKLKRLIKSLEMQQETDSNTREVRIGDYDRSFSLNELNDSQLESYTQKIQQLSETNQQAQKEIEEYKSHIKQLQQTNIKIEKEMHENRLKLISLESQSTLEKNMSNTIRRLNPGLMLNTKDNKDKVIDLTNKLKKSELELRDMRFKLKLKTNDFEQAEASIKKLNKKVKDLNNELTELENNSNSTLLFKNKYERENKDLKDYNHKLQKDLLNFRANSINNRSSSMISINSSNSTFRKTMKTSIVKTDTSDLVENDQKSASDGYFSDSSLKD